LESGPELSSFSFVLVIDGCSVYTYPKEEGRFIRRDLFKFTVNESEK
jgi:hypothetical protein